MHGYSSMVREEVGPRDGRVRADRVLNADEGLNFQEEI